MSLSRDIVFDILWWPIEAVLSCGTTLCPLVGSFSHSRVMILCLTPCAAHAASFLSKPLHNIFRLPSSKTIYAFSATTCAATLALSSSYCVCAPPAFWAAFCRSRSSAARWAALPRFCVLHFYSGFCISFYSTFFPDFLCDFLQSASAHKYRFV